MLKLLRYIIAILLIVVAVIWFKKQNGKQRILRLILNVFLSLIVLITPVENLFLKFDTPEQAFNYAVSNRKIIKIVENKQSALVIYSEKGSTNATLISEHNGKWKANFLPDDQILSRSDNNEIIMITKERKSNNFYIMIAVGTDVKSVTDNQNSRFEVFSKDGYWTHYVAYVVDYKGDYIISIDDDQYKIKI